MSDAEQLQDLVDGLAARLGCAVSLEDPQLRLIAYSETGDDADAVRRRSILRRESPDDVRAWLFSHGLPDHDGPTTLPPLRRLGMRERLVCPVRHAGALLGYLWVVQAPAGAEADAAAVADAAGVVLYRRRLAEGGEREEEVAALERAVVEGGSGPVAVVRTDGVDEAAVVDRQAALERALRRRTGGAGGRCLRIGGELVLAGAGVDDLRAAVGARVAGAGVGDDLAAARRAALIAALLGADAPLTPADVPLEAHLLAACGDDPRRVTVHPTASALIDAGHGLAETIEVYLDLAGDAAATTRALSVSRAGLYRRLHRAQDAAGFDLHDGAQRTLVHLGLKAARLVAARG